MPFLCFWIARVGIALGKDVHWESVLGKEIVNFVAYLKAFRTNAWTYDGVKVGGIDAVGRDENIDVCLDNALESAFPSGMNRRDDVRCFIPKKHWHAVGCLDCNTNVGKVGAECIHAIHLECLLQGILGEKFFVDNDCCCSMHLMMGHD